MAEMKSPALKPNGGIIACTKVADEKAVFPVRELQTSCLHSHCGQGNRVRCECFATPFERRGDREREGAITLCQLSSKIKHIGVELDDSYRRGSGWGKVMRERKQELVTPYGNGVRSPAGSWSD